MRGRLSEVDEADVGLLFTVSARVSVEGSDAALGWCSSRKRSRSRACISAHPKMLAPRHFEGSDTLWSLSGSPMPQMVSVGLA